MKLTVESSAWLNSELESKEKKLVSDVVSPSELLNPRSSGLAAVSFPEIIKCTSWIKILYYWILCSYLNIFEEMNLENQNQNF